jgi:hypothetical protein
VEKDSPAGLKRILKTHGSRRGFLRSESSNHGKSYKHTMAGLPSFGDTPVQISQLELQFSNGTLSSKFITLNPSAIL